MKSIRFSLVGSFLVLLATALFAVSLLVYTITQQALEEKQRTTKELLENQNRVTQKALEEKVENTKHLLFNQAEDRRIELKTQLDNKLLAQAQQLARLAQFQFEFNRSPSHQLNMLAGSTALLAPNSYVTSPLWMLEGARNNPLGDLVTRMSVSSIQFDEAAVDVRHLGRAEYFQINSEWGHEWRSRSLGETSFPFDREQAEKTDPYDVRYVDGYIGNRISIRRVQFKAPVYRVQFLRVVGGAEPPPPPPPMENRPPPPPRPLKTERTSRPNTVFFIQCAASTSGLESALADVDLSLKNDITGLVQKEEATVAELNDKLEADLAEQQELSEQKLAFLRSRLLLISLTTFGATVVGGIWLVGLGLWPLNQLSEAVSRVTARDFHLPLDENKLPVELKPIAHRLTETLEQLQRAFDREKQAAADISHELRTPLAAMLTTLELALRKPRTAEEYREMIRDCRDSGQQMNVLVERLLTLARLDAGVDNLRPTEIDATGLADQCASLVRPLAEAKGVDLRVHLDKPVFITADPNKLREVVTNLLHNAIQYNRPNGTIDLKVSRNNGHLELAVEDTGIGISPEVRSHIFERFYRVDPSRQAEGMHAGLGLAIVKGYVDLMGGSISVDSTPGQGSAFRVSLPIKNLKKLSMN